MKWRRAARIVDTAAAAADAAAVSLNRRRAAGPSRAADARTAHGTALAALGDGGTAHVPQTVVQRFMAEREGGAAARFCTVSDDHIISDDHISHDHIRDDPLVRPTGGEGDGVGSPKPAKRVHHSCGHH
jgi:hypothetical protein